jgi:hypothetical protein
MSNCYINFSLLLAIWIKAQGLLVVLALPLWIIHENFDIFAVTLHHSLYLVENKSDLI